jgi:hypothetical protein
LAAGVAVAVSLAVSLAVAVSVAVALVDLVYVVVMETLGASGTLVMDVNVAANLKSGCTTFDEQIV